MSQAAEADLLCNAAAATLEAIRFQRTLVPPRLQVLLAYIERHLFDAELSVSRMKRECGIKDNSIAINFHSAVGLAPGAYIGRCRAAVAQRLLSDTALPVWRISAIVGYSSIQVFSRAFFRQTGFRPSTYRRQHRSTGAALTIPVAPAGVEPTRSPETVLYRALRGDLADQEAADLIRELLALYPPRGIGRRQEAAATR